MTTNQKKGYTMPIIMMIALFGMISFVTGLQNPMGVIVKNQFEASTFMASLGYFANFIAYAFMGIPAGMLLQRIGYKKTALLAVAVGFVGVGIMYLSGVVSQYVVYLIGAFVSGFSMCMLNTVVNPMLNTLAGGGKKGNQLIQIGGSFNSLCATIVPVLVGYLMGDVAKATISSADPALFIAMGTFALVFVVLGLVNIPEPSIATDDAEKGESFFSTLSKALSFRHFMFGTIAIFLYVGIEVGIQFIMNPYMTETTAKGGLGIDPTTAGSIVGTYWFLMLIGRLVGAAVGAKVSSRAMLTFVSILGLILVFLAMFVPETSMTKMPVFMSDISFGMVEVPMTVMLLALCGLSTSVMWGGIFNLAVEGLGKYTAAASGIFMVMVCGGGIIPAIQSFVADYTGYVNSYWVVVAALIFLLFYALVGSKVTKRAD